MMPCKVCMNIEAHVNNLVTDGMREAAGASTEHELDFQVFRLLCAYDELLPRPDVSFDRYLHAHGITLHPWQLKAANALLGLLKRDQAAGKSFLINVLADYVNHHIGEPDAV